MCLFLSCCRPLLDASGSLHAPKLDFRFVRLVVMFPWKQIKWTQCLTGQLVAPPPCWLFVSGACGCKSLLHLCSYQDWRIHGCVTLCVCLGGQLTGSCDAPAAVSFFYDASLRRLHWPTVSWTFTAKQTIQDGKRQPNKEAWIWQNDDSGRLLVSTLTSSHRRNICKSFF